MNVLPLSPDLLDTFRSLSVKKRQGVLEIISPEREYELTFYEGKIIHADRIDQSFIQFLTGKVKSISSKLSSELENVGRGEQITRLLQLTELELPKLIELKKAYDRETLSYLADEHSFSFDFRTKIVRCPEGLSLELSPGHYLLDLLETMASTEEASQAAVPETAKITICSEGIVNGEKKTVITSTVVDQTPQPNVTRTRIKRSHKKKHRRPPRAGRFKVTPISNKEKLIGALKLNADQALMGVKLTLILILALSAPAFLASWSQTVFAFLVL